MTFHLKTYPDALRQLFVSCSVEETNAAFDQALTLLQKTFSLAGYRKGKVPLDIISKTNPPELMKTVSDILTQKAFQYIEDQKTSLYGQPRFQPIAGLSRDKEFLFSLVYEVYPTLTNNVSVDSLKLSYEACEADKEFIEATMCRQINLLDSTSGTVKEYDLVKVEVLNKDYKGDKPEASFDTSRLELLIGKKTDETFKISFDELSGYLPEFVGKVSDPLEVKIVDILRAKSWDKVTDKEIEEATPFKTKEEYVTQSQVQFNGIVDQYNNSKKAEALAEHVGSQLEVELPKSLWLNNLRDLVVKTAEKEILKEEMSLAQLSSNKEVSEKFSKLPVDAVEGLAFILWLEKTSVDLKITLEDQELEYYYYRYAQSNNIPMNDFKKHISAEEKASIRSEAIREKTMGQLLEKLEFTVSKTIPLSVAIKSFQR